MVLFYFLLLLGIGYYAKKKSTDSPEDYFLAGRSFGVIVLFFSLAATNFSAFTFLGFAGNAYNTGFGQYGIMAFGTGFMAIMFYIIGRKVWLLGKTYGYVTPAELIGKHFNSLKLRILVMVVMVLFTIPYLATQAIGAGILLEYVTNGGFQWMIGAIVTMVVIMVYVLFGGMRGSGWTDVIQGIIMTIALILAVIFVANGLGGFEQANLQSFQMQSNSFSRPGITGYFTPQIWLSFLLLWLFADPMFPQIFSRFYTAKNQHSLKYAMVLYPLLVSFLFICPVLIGMWAHGSGTNISLQTSDMILPYMVETFAPSSIFLFVMIGALAALMSTADSQLLSLSTMISQDIPFKTDKISSISLGKIMVILLTCFSIFYVVLGFDPNSGIMGTLVQTTFPGLAVLFPTVISVLYWKNTNEWGCIFSIIFGELFVFLITFGVIPSFGILSGIWGVFIAGIILIFINLLFKEKNSQIC
jgi:SSS family solute:Na+ symporter